jgi:BirA family biotin operon repressor/biotin-[acetyl-CoA-carboxylase] ligase
MAAEIRVFAELDSTNAEARRCAQAGEIGPVWLRAERQSAGRGRRGRAWDGGQGNLTATLFLTLDKPPMEAAQLSYVAALAVGDLVGSYTSQVRAECKWPNDVLIDGRKVAGVLIESGPALAGDLWLAVGIGVNLASFPEAVERPATALSVYGPAPHPGEAMARLAQFFDANLDIWLTYGFEPIKRVWTARAVGIGEACEARLPSETVRGRAEGLDADGALLLRLPGGEARRITAGDVFFGTM